MYYRLRRTFVPVALPGDALLFRSDTRAYKVEGSFAKLLARLLLPQLDGRTSVEQIAQSADVPASSLEEHLNTLVRAGVMESGRDPLSASDGDPRLNLVEALGVTANDAHVRLQETRIAIFGLEGVGEMVGEQLLIAGFRRLLLVDPAGSVPERAIASKLQARASASALNVSDMQTLDRAKVLELARASDLLIACWDKGYESGNHWVNRASVELAIPALFCSLGGIHALAGPFVVPGVTACYMCSRMRAVAAAENYEEAMATERFFDSCKQSSFAQREFLPTSLSLLASLLATEVFKFIVLKYQPALAGTVIELDPITLEFTRHAILEQPHCPVCRKKKLPRVTTPDSTSSSRSDQNGPDRCTP